MYKRVWIPKRGTKEKCESWNGVLEDGELLFERDTYMLKVGDGKRHYKELPYVGVIIQGKRYEIKLSN